jgi:hypothetical protein
VKLFPSHSLKNKNSKMRESSPRVLFLMRILFFLIVLFCWVNLRISYFYYSKVNSKIQELKTVKSNSPITDFIRNLRSQFLSIIGITENGEDEYEKNDFFIGNQLPQVLDKNYKGVYTEENINLFLLIPNEKIKAINKKMKDENETMNDRNENENTENENDEFMVKNEKILNENKSESGDVNENVTYKKVHIADLMSRILAIKKRENLPNDYFQKIALHSLNLNHENYTRNIYFQQKEVENSNSNFNSSRNNSSNDNDNDNGSGNYKISHRRKFEDLNYQKPSLLCATFCTLSEKPFRKY